MPPEVLSPIIDGLHRVIRGKGVTYGSIGYHATTGENLFKGFPLNIAGKTGTAQTGKKVGGVELNHAWFAGFAPANEPIKNSAVDKMAEQARERLKKVIEQHPGTPWAKSAERELQAPVGWKFTDEKK